MKSFGTKVEAEPGSPPDGMYVPIHFPSLVLLNTRTTDGRQINADGFGVQDLPRSIKNQTVSAGGHDGAMIVGRLDYVEMDGQNASGDGWLLNTPDGKMAAHLVKTQALRGNSVDLSAASKDIEINFYEDGDSFWIEVDFKKANLAATTLCMQPAFENAGAVIPDGWDVEGVDAAAEEAVVAAMEPETEHAYAFSVIDKRPTLDPALFAAPESKAAYAVEVDSDNHVHGYVAAWNTPHTSNPAVKPPHSRTSYAYFANGHVLAGDGSIPTGRLTLGGNHADQKSVWRDAIDHYANTCMAWADVAVGEDDFGIWVSGIVRPGTTAENVHVGRASVLSGDWRYVGGSMEMVAALSVNAGGFPLPRRELAARGFSNGDGTPVSLLSAGIIERSITLPGGISPKLATDLSYLADRARQQEAAEMRAELEAELAPQ